MDLADLRIFVAVAREGGVTRAAERLNRVQSNVTTRLRQLEEENGKLKKIVADLSLDKEMLQDVIRRKL